MYVRAAIRVSLLLLLAGAGLPALAAPEPPAPELPDSFTVDYATLIDRRQISHTGDSVGVLLRRIAGRPLAAAASDPALFEAHKMLEPLIEPYAFVLPDALDALVPPGGRPWVEIGSLWHGGGVEPAWVELLRARRYVVESDGAGRLRAFLPIDATALTDSVSDAERAYRAAWPVLRHLFAAERARLSGNASRAPTLEVSVYPYLHVPEISRFKLGTAPARFDVDATRPDGRRPPFDLAELRRFLDAGLQIEGARLDAEGNLRWLGSQGPVPPTLLGQPLSVADFAVAYRAIFYGGLTEPYMSLDRGFAPQTFIVNYGGRLRDTTLGTVSLLADIRFKTFSQGIDIATGRDVRGEVRELLPGFGTHLEQMVWDPSSAGVTSQQTRLWFYPDDVDLTVSAQGDVLVLRRSRMSAASERLEGIERTAASVRPWTRRTVDSINANYDRLAGLFPEMSDLNQVVRLLALFTWLKRADLAGAIVPELDLLLREPLPQRPTPRFYPQLLAFNAAPPAGSDRPVEVHERLDVVEALDRLDPIDGRPLAARRAFDRAFGALDPQNAAQARLRNEIRATDPATLDDSTLDILTYRARRLLMHDRVLKTIEAETRKRIADRMSAGEQVRVFSIGIGGIDLGMEKVLDRAQGRSMDLRGAFGGGLVPAASARASSARASAPQPGVEAGPRQEWRVDPPETPTGVLPDHGAGRGRVSVGSVHRASGNRVEIGPAGRKKNRPQWTLVVHGENGPEPRSRRLFLDDEGRVDRIERVESARRIGFRIERNGDRLSAVVDELGSALAAAAADEDGRGEEPAPLPAGLVLLEPAPEPALPGAPEPQAVPLVVEGAPSGVRRSMRAAFPRPLLRRLILGRATDMTPGLPLSGLSPLPPTVGKVDAVMVPLSDRHRLPPWEVAAEPTPGEENPLRLARALNRWWRGGDLAHRAVVGVDGDRSAERWAASPRPARALLLLPGDGFPETHSGLAARLRRSWGDGRVVTSVDEIGAIEEDEELVVLLSAEAAGPFADRLRALAGNPALRGKLLAAWSLSGPVRADLPALLIEEGSLAGLGIGESVLGETRAATEGLALLRESLSESPRAERLDGPFLWYF